MACVALGIIRAGYSILTSRDRLMMYAVPTAIGVAVLVVVP
jgi:hypothetical protein